MSRSTDGTSPSKTRPTPAELAAMQRSFPPEEGQVGRGGQEATADRREEGRHRARVLNSVRDFMATRKRKRKGQS